MRKTLLIMRAEIGTTLHRKTFLFFAIILPLILGVIAGVLMWLNRDNAPLELAAATVEAETVVAGPVSSGYVDEGHLITDLPAEGSSPALPSFQDIRSAEEALANGTISGYFLIPPDYLQAGEITYVTATYNPLDQDLDTRALEWLLMYNLLDRDMELASQVWQPLAVEVTSLAPPQMETAEESWFTEMYPTLMVLILYMVILIPAGVLVSAFTDEKKNRVMEVLISSISAKELLAGKLLALGILGLFEAAVWMGTLWMVASFGGQALAIPDGFTIPTSLLLWSLIFFLLGYGIYGMQLAAVGALASDAKETRGANFLVMAPMILSYTFMILIFESPHSIVSLALSLFPLTSPIAMIARLVVTDVPFWQPFLAVLLLLVSMLMILRLTASMFRAQILLSGQPFSASIYYKALLGRT